MSTRGLQRRRRALAALAAVIVLAGGAAAAVALVTRPAAPGPAPDDGAAALVPAGALAYANVSLDARRPSVRQALALARRLPGVMGLAGRMERRLAALVAPAGGGPVASAGLSAELPALRPWIGHELAIALLAAPGGVADSLVLAAVRSPRAARAFLAGSGAVADGAYRGLPLWRYGNGTEATLAGGFLAAGQRFSVRSAIDVVRGAPALAAAGPYRSASGGAGASAVLEGYASAAGVRELLEPRGGALGALGLLLDRPAMRAVAVALAPDGSHGLRLRLRSARASHAGAQPFAATFPQRVPAGAALMLDVRDLPRAAPEILRELAALGLAGDLGPLLSKLGAALHAAGADVNAALSVFSGESAVMLGSLRGQGGALVVLSRVRDPAHARYELASLIPALEEAFRSGALAAGGEPASSQQTVAGVEVTQLALEPALTLEFAVDGHEVAIATGMRALAAVLSAHRTALAREPAYAAVLGNRPPRVASLLFLDLSQLLGPAERTGLTNGASLQPLRAALANVSAVGVASTAGETDSTVEIVLQIR